MSATTSDDVVPELRSVPGEKKKSLKGEGMVGPYSITSTAQGMTDTKKAVIAEYLTKLDAVWGRESPLVKRWREGREGKKSFFDPFFEAVMNLAASTRIYFRFLITMEAWLLSIVSIAATIFFSVYEVKGQRLAVNVSWAFISFAIIFPLTTSLNETFKRRESALDHIADVKAFLVSYYQAHRDWDWGANGRAKLPRDHLANSRFILTALIVDMRDVLTAPSTSRQVHFHTDWGKKQRVEIRALSHEITDRITQHFDRISLAVEELKYAGQPGNESSRMRQFITNTMRAWEKLKYIKHYRTPIATRAFARVYIFLHPIFWGPYYAYLVEQMLNENDDDGTSSSSSIPVHVGFAYFYACALSVLTSLAMMGLFNVRYRLEDPFQLAHEEEANKAGVDQIHVMKEFAEIQKAFCVEFKSADLNPGGGGPVREQCFPLPDECRIAHLEMEPCMDITATDAHIKKL